MTSRPLSQPPNPLRGSRNGTTRPAKDAVKAFEKRTKGRGIPLRERMAALEDLAKGSSAKLVKPLSRVVLADSSVVVCTRAAELLGQQPDKEAKKSIARLIDHKRVEGMPGVQAALVHSLSRAGYTSRDWKLIDGLFEKKYAPERTGLQKAILQLVGEHKELQAIDLLIDNLGEPVPEDPTSASNPPASYWEARWKAWEVWRDDVKSALLAITGQRFSTKKEAKAWLRKNRKTLERKR